MYSKHYLIQVILKNGNIFKKSTKCERCYSGSRKDWCCGTIFADNKRRVCFYIDKSKIKYTKRDPTCPCLRKILIKTSNE